jgi:hypothetical protein
VKLPGKLVVTLRWLGFIPGAFVGAWLAWLLLFYGNRIGAQRMGFDADDFIHKLFTEIISNAGMGAAFVYAGACIAPNGRKVVAWILALIAVLLAGFAMFPAYIHQNWWSVVRCIAIASGAGLVAYSLSLEQLDPK